ncbi:MAG TPA: DUF3300 domain-containing protein [Steroidobacteraceae bacterium]|nr:DUF3300 domain-containing protein [Steroidobacteraceae bacterium]
MMKHARVGLILSACAMFAAAQAQTPAPNPPLPPMDQLLAPVALYPDALLAQVLTCATSPGQVTEMNTWLQQNKQLQGTELQDAAQQRGYDASFVALALFPDVMNQLASQIGWTTELGTAFLSDPKGVMDSVQRLRAQAQAAGNLKSTPQQVVNTEKQNGQQIIVIQPANPQVVYVPVYNPTVVYWPPPPGAVVFAFGLGIAIGAAMSNNAYYAPYGWGAWGMGWHTHTVVVRGGVWVVPPYARYPYVRPIPMPYGGYRPRPYVYAPTTVNINRITVNNPGYAGGATPRPKPYAPVQRPTTLPAPPSSGGRPTTMPAQRPATAGSVPTTRPAQPAAGPNSPARPATGADTRPASPGTRPASQPGNPGIADYGSRGYNAPSSVRPTERAQTNSSAFTGYQSGGAERAASQRGQGSVSRGKSRPSGSR